MVTLPCDPLSLKASSNLTSTVCAAGNSVLTQPSPELPPTLLTYTSNLWAAYPCPVLTAPLHTSLSYQGSLALRPGDRQLLLPRLLPASVP